MSTAPLLDRTFLERLERLAIRWQQSFPGLVGGHNRSHYAGPGQEFLDHRHFHHGDDLRAVNWRAYLRLEKMFLKMFQVEPRVPVRMLIDTSLSMSATGPAKFDFARRLAAALSYIALVRLDTITIHPFSQSLAQKYVCGGGRHRFSPVMDYLAGLQTAGRTGMLEMVRQFIGLYSQRGLLIIISDFLDDDGCERALHHLADFGHELLLVQVWAEEDRNPPWTGELDLADAESGAKLKIQVDEEARARYTRGFDEYAATLQRLALRNQGRYVGVSCAMPIEEAIFGPLVRAKSIA
jgi:uncharacterized protein (DUF58 family)